MPRWMEACPEDERGFRCPVCYKGVAAVANPEVKVERRGGSPARVAAIVLAYALVHSLLASRQAKGGARRILGGRGRDGLYRILYNAQAVLLFAWATRAFVGLPDRTLYRVPWPWSWAMYGAQLGGVGLMAWAAWAVGIARMTGLGPLASLVRGGRPEREPEAQGPVLGTDGEMSVRGPFRFTRHPANWGPLVVVLLFPRMTVNRAALAFVSTAYLVLGSLHEEYRLLAAHRHPYERYRVRVPFLLGSTRGTGRGNCGNVSYGLRLACCGWILRAPTRYPCRRC